MTTRLQKNDIKGPQGEKMTVSWMPGNRLRIDLADCGPAVVTKIFPDPKGKVTHVEINYGHNSKQP